MLLEGAVTKVVIGFADHSGWCVAVAVVATGGWFEVVARERLEILEPGWTLPSPPGLPRQPYHAVAEQGMDRRVIEEVLESAADGAAAEIKRIRESLRRTGHDLGIAVVPVGTVRLPASLDAILGSHALLHAAEGELFREALAEGASRCGLTVVRAPRKDIIGLAASASGLSLQAFEAKLKDAGKPLGPPWTADQRLAMAGAMLALDGGRLADAGPDRGGDKLTV